jgi:hypothetical protein
LNDLFSIFSRYAHYFQEFGNLIDDNSRNMLQKSCVPMDNSLPSNGSFQLKQENCHNKINSDITCNQFFPYKTPSLTDDTCERKSMRNYDRSLIDNNVSCNKRSKENQNTIKPTSSVLSTLEADKTGVAVESVARR